MPTNTAQLIYVSQGNGRDGGIKYVNSTDATASDFIVLGPSTNNTSIQDPYQFAADTAAGIYFVIDPNFTGNGSQNGTVLMGNLFDPTEATTTAYTVQDTHSSPNAFGEAWALAIDTTNHFVYVSEDTFNGPLTDFGAHTGIIKFSYNPVTGAIGAPVDVFVRPSGPNNEILSLSLDTAGQKLFFVDDSEGQFGTAPSITNSVEVLNLSTNAVTTLVTLASGAQYFPANTANNQYTSGGIVATAVDTTDHLVFFTTGTGSSNATYQALNRIYVIDDHTGAQTPVQLTELATFNNYDPKFISFDSQHHQLYVSYINTSGNLGALVRYDVNVPTPGSPIGVTLTNPVSFDLHLSGDGGSPLTTATFPLGSFLDDLPVLTTSGTTTHAAEQSTSVTLLSATPTITDSDGDHLASATVKITGGTFVSNETSANDDHLTVLASALSGTNITASYDTASETLTLTGYDTLTHYQQALAGVQYNTTGDNPTNYGNNATRTITWQANDGAIGDPSGTNTTTTTLNIDAKNDAPVNNLPGTPTVNEDVQTAITGITITDVDADPANQDITVTLSVAHGTLNLLTNVAGGITGADITGGAQDSTTITITATQNQINATFAGNGLRYKSDLNFNSGFATETLHIVTNDNSHTDSAAFPGAQTDTDNLTINVAAVNDNPNLQPDTTTPVSYTENAAALALFSAENVDTPIADVDQSANYSGGSIDLNITAGSVTGDRISLTGSRFVIVGTSIQDTANANAVVGTIGATNGTSHVTVSALTANATPSVVDALIKSFGFDSTSDNPGAGDRTVTLTFNDGGNTGSGGALTDAVTQTVHVTPVNDAPVSTTPVAHYTATEQVNLSLQGTGLSVSDVDGNSGNETVTLSVVEGLITLSAGNSGVGSISGSGTSSVTFSGTLTQLNALLSGSSTGTLIYNDNTDTPAASTSLTLLIHDNGNTGTGGDLSATSSSTIDITAVNDAPTATAPAAHYSATEQTSVSLKNASLSVSDVDALGGVERVTLSVVEGTLNATVGDSSVTIISGNGTSSLVVDGTIAQLNAFLGSGAVSSSTLAYIDSSDNPSASTTLTLQINDKGNTSSPPSSPLTASANTVIDITAVNDAPVATTPVAHYSATEQVNLNLHGTGLSVSDADGNSGSETVTLSVGEGTITLAAGNSGVGSISGSGTSSVTFSGTLTQLNALLSGSSTGTLVYNDNTDTPAASTTLTLLVHDNGNTGTGGDLSNSATATIDITAVNDAPIAVMTTDPYTATEQTTLNLKSTGMSVSDVDSGGASETVTLSVGEGTLHVAAGSSGATVVSGDNTSLVTLTGTLAQINALLNTDGTSVVSYIDNSDNPGASTTLTLHIDDGGATGGGALTGNDTSTINITAVNDAPVATITPTEYDGSPNTAINLKANGLSVSDVDGNAGSETVTLSVTSGTLTVTTGGSGAGVVGSGTSSVTITGTTTQINALLNTDGTSTVSYVDSAGGTKTLTLLIHDNGNTGGGDLSAQDTAIIQLDLPPAVGNTGQTVGYIEQQTAPSAVVIDNDLTVTDADAPGSGAQIHGATAQITTGGFAGDVLAAGALAAGITASYDSGTFTLTLSGDGSLADYQAALQAVTFASTSDNPTNFGADTSRTVTWTVTDNFNVASSPATSFISVTAVNDAPVATITPASYSATEQTALNLKSTGLAVSDIDGGTTGQNETATLSVTEGTLTVTAGGSGAIVTNSGTSSVTITGTLAQINALLSTDGTSTVSYTDGSDNPAASATLTLAIDDGGATGGGPLSGSDTATINITAVNDAPVATITPASYSATENVALSLKNNGLAVSDIDGNSGSETVTLAVTDGILNVTTGTSGAGVSGSGTSSVTITGTLAQINALLNTDGSSTVSYVENNDNPGATASLSLTIHDNGNTGGGDLSSTDTAVLNITAANDAPVATITPATYAATEQTALDLKNNGLSVSDVDGNAGSETVTLSVIEGTLTVTAGGSGAIVTNSGTSSVTITGTVAQINALLNTDGTSTVSYTDGSDNPAASTTLTLLIHDNGNTGGGDLSSSDTATINITAVNDAPVATITPATYSVTENAALSLKNNGLSVSDIDGNSGSETVTLAVTDGIVNVTTGGSGAAVSGSGTGSVTITGTIAQINALLNTDGTSTVSYVENDNNPGTTASLSLTIHDNGNTGGGDLSSTDTAILNITQVNNAPVATITPATYAATEQTALDLKNNGLSVSDVDGNAGSETVTLSVGEGVLNVGAGTSGAIVTNSGTGTVTITGSASQINALLNTDGTSTVSYIDNSDTPAATASLVLTIHDNGNTGGGDLSSSDTATINITAVNDAPVFTNLGGGAHPSFVENGAAVVLDNNVTVSDPELNAAGNYGGATLTLARNGGANADDTFAGTGSLDLVDSNGLGENVSLNGGATFIGTFHQPGDGTFSITFNASATAANVASVMQQIAYANASDNPDNPTIQINWSFNDGNTGSQGTGGAGIATGSVIVDITPVDDAPVLLNVAPGAAYTIGSSGVTLSPALAVFDVDATAPSPLQGIASATIKIASGFFAGDELFVNLATSGGHFVTADGDTTNISVQSNVLGMLVLSGTDTVGHYQSVLDAVSYHSTAADPSNAGANPTRSISWQVNDGSLNSQTPNPDPNNLVNETVLHFDVAPKIDLDASAAGTGFTTTFTENGAPIAIVDTDVSIVDPDDANLSAATIVLTDAKPTDALSIAGLLPGGIDSSIDTSTPGQITVHLINSASLADYQTALGQIRFVNSSDAPDTTDRDITVFVANGADSNVAHATIHVVAVDDAPVAANSSASGSEDTPISGIVSATDVDNTASQLTYSLVGANGGAAHGAVVFHADGSYTYNPVHDFNGSDSFSFKANDGQLDSNVAHVSLTVSAVDDAPVAANGSASGNEDTPISGAVSASDVDNTPGQLSYALVGANGGATHGILAFNANGTFTYTPASNFNGSDSFNFKVNDGTLDSNVATESLTINAVNDAPVNTVPGPVNAQAGLDAAIIGLAVSDVDAVSLTTSLHVDHGTLSVAAVGGAAVNGSGTGTVTLTGSVAQIDAALAAQNNVLYHSAPDFIGTDHLTMTTNDGGGTGIGGPQTDTDVVDINVGHGAIGAFIAFSILGSSDFNLH
jgi:hypothetical protein